MLFLPLSFFVTAILYAAVGFGGGSTYNALLVLAGTDYRTLPIIALLCNLIVVSGGAYCFYRAGHVDIKRVIPWIVTSVPAALLGGYLNISESFFTGLLGFSLLAAGLRMVLIKNIVPKDVAERKQVSIIILISESRMRNWAYGRRCYLRAKMWRK